MSSNEVTIQVPLSITVRLGASTDQIMLTPAFETAPLPLATRPVAYYEGYTGYQSDFLDTQVHLPVLSPEQRAQAALNAFAEPGEDAAVLPYTNFSIVINRSRQLAYYTVVNINGTQSARPGRGNDRWYFDPRIAESEQVGEELYARNALDRGHLVRRLDPVWGPDAQRANEDTFHFTNCSPQHEGFNQNSETWLGLEDHVLNFANQAKRKLTVFTGPVFGTADPLYKGVRLPLAFWKIVVFVRNSGTLGAAAFVLEQAALIDTLPGIEAAFEPGTYRITLDKLIERTGLDFAYLKIYESALSDNQLQSVETEQILLAGDYSNLHL